MRSCYLFINIRYTVYAAQAFSAVLVDGVSQDIYSTKYITVPQSRKKTARVRQTESDI